MVWLAFINLGIFFLVLALVVTDRRRVKHEWRDIAEAWQAIQNDSGPAWEARPQRPEDAS